MSWFYYTQTTPLSWRDKTVTDYLLSKGVDLKIMSINYNLKYADVDMVEDLVFHKNDVKPARIILSNLFTSLVEDSYFYDFFLSLLFAEICKKNDIHYTYLNQEYLSQTSSKDYVRKLLSMNKNLYLNFWILMNENMNEQENGLVQLTQNIDNYCVDHGYHISVCSDVLPIVFDMIQKKKIGSYEITNPTNIEYAKVLALYSEYMSTPISKDVTDDVTSTMGSHLNVNTESLENEYFILPSYQALQRLIKRVRKSSMIKRDINLQHKCCILVTGGYGFIGSNLVHFLYHQYPKCQIVNIDRLDYCSRKENLDDLLGSERVNCYQIDLCETEKVEAILKKHHVDYIFHLAAQSHVDNSFNNSLQFSRDNMYGTHSLLEACKNYGKVSRFLHVSTDEIYGETLQMDPFAEDMLPNPTNPYAATKVGAEYIVKSYFHCFELPIIIVRGNNVYGPRQFPEKMIPKFITSVLDGMPCTVAGNGLMQRNFIYVEDVCRGLVAVMENGKIDEIYNIGSDDEKSVLSIARTIIKTMTGLNSDDDTPDYLVYVKDRYYNDFRYSINSEKIRRLGWKPKMTFEEGLQKTIQYYTENLNLYQQNRPSKKSDTSSESGDESENEDECNEKSNDLKLVR